jgi:DNA-binding NtrC family response regulator
MAETREVTRRILLVDDDQIILDSLGSFLELEGYEVDTAQAVGQAIDALGRKTYNLVISDVTLPQADGMELLAYVRREQPDLEVIMVTGYATVESAVEAMKQGAYEYLTKPIIDDDLRMTVRRALQQQDLVAENRQLKQALSEQGRFGRVIGRDYRMDRVFDLMEAVADSPTTVLITGESGTGKSLIGRAIHAHSPRREGPFVEVSCGALPETLLESELFGHVRGAFTHAVSDKQGKFAVADGGTIFLDEIATASAQLQMRLLRVLQERVFEPVGSNTSRKVDVRVILASNQDLKRQVEAGHFREDLYYRVNVVNIEIPPLRRRVGDIPLLAEHFLERFAASRSRPLTGFLPEAMEIMRRYPWPGNVRELENCVERASVLCRSERVTPDDLPPVLLEYESTGRVGAQVADDDASGRTLSEALKGPEKRIIIDALKAHEGNRNKTAEQLGINRTTLYKKMRKHELL